MRVAATADLHFTPARFSALHDQLNRVRDIAELAVPPGNRLERLRGDRVGQHSIRINGQHRICFVGRGLCRQSRNRGLPLVTVLAEASPRSPFRRAGGYQASDHPHIREKCSLKSSFDRSESVSLCRPTGNISSSIE